MAGLLTEPQWFFGTDIRLIPEWFRGLDSYAQLIVFCITLFISIYAFRIYKLTNKKESRNLGVSFLFISASYLLWAILNLTFVAGLAGVMCSRLGICMADIVVDLAIYLFMTLNTLGILILTYTTVSNSTLKSFTLTLFVIYILSIFTTNSLLYYYILTAIMFALLAYYSTKHYMAQKTGKLLIMCLAFVLLLVKNLVFIVALYYVSVYLIGILLNLLAYLLLLYDMVMVLRGK